MRHGDRLDHVEQKTAATTGACVRKHIRMAPAPAGTPPRSPSPGLFPRSAEDLRRLFEGMRVSPPPGSGADRISALPDYMLQDILSLLPAQEAVRTCVLARSWRHLWRSTLGLRLVGRDGPGPPQDLQKFGDNLLRLREESADLHNVEIKFYSNFEDDLPYVRLWIRFVVMCKVRFLTIHNCALIYLDESYFGHPSMASPHLRTLDLAGVTLGSTFLDFTSCPALKGLKMNDCHITTVDEISSSSLEHFITGCLSLSFDRLHVSAPGLVSLKIDDFEGVAPFFENMMLLETALVNLGSYNQFSLDICLNYADSGISCGDNACFSCEDYNDNCSSNCVLLGGISSARHLELISESPNIIFARDLEHRPIFSNVKTLLLNEYWCDAPGCNRLAYILKNSPVLEKLTLELFSKGPNHNVEMKGSYMAMEGSSAISEHLKIVEVKCNKVDERILEVLKFLRAFNIRFSSE